MKVLQGQLQETIFDIPADHDGHEHSLDVKKVSLLHKNEVAYISSEPDDEAHHCSHAHEP